MFRLFSNRYTGPGQGEKRRDRERPRTSGNQAIWGTQNKDPGGTSQTFLIRGRITSATQAFVNLLSYVVNIPLNARDPTEHQTFFTQRCPA